VFTSKRNKEFTHEMGLRYWRIKPDME